LQEGQAHVDFSQLDGGITDVLETTEKVNLPSPKLLDSYTDSMMVAFFQTYIANEPSYKVYLQSAYVNYLSQGQDFKSYLITNPSANKLDTFIETYIRENNINLQPIAQE
jgi:predicted dienelactone hydrolase